MKCKFEHDEDCCNSGSPQYMCKCKPDVCHSEVPISNGDRIRAMSDEELGDQLVINIDGPAKCRMYLSALLGRVFVSRRDAVRETISWIQQPAEEV